MPDDDDATEIQRHRATTNQIESDDQFYFGINDSRTRLIEWLIKNEETKCGVISVQGMGGSGKTTLAAYVYNNREIKKHFQHHAWLTVSQTYNIDDILGTIMKQFLREEREGLDTQQTERMEQPLIEDAAWSLFCRWAFHGYCPPIFKNLTEELVKKCKELPLTIVVLGGLMYSKKSLYKWQNVHDFFVDSLLLEDLRIK
ncbi:putative disease resistance protein [Acorus gramineus]|uniref:Disease resistance protein n=1 Tax=Acorus gramineus TaxID=55184 RepID=A0AAV9B970_ACOGR|nr:putative disease resistance protein [Acorus gramineus]